MAAEVRVGAASLGLALIVSIAAACSSKSGGSSDGGPPGGSGGASGVGGLGGVGGAGGGGGGPQPRPFWCPSYRPSDAAAPGWVDISAKVVKLGTGPMGDQRDRRGQLGIGGGF